MKALLFLLPVIAAFLLLLLLPGAEPTPPGRPPPDQADDPEPIPPTEALPPAPEIESERAEAAAPDDPEKKPGEEAWNDALAKLAEFEHVRLTRHSAQLTDLSHLTFARPATDPASGRAPRVEPGEAPALAIDALLRDGLENVRGTVSIEGAREPELETGVPVSLTGRVIEAETGRPVTGAEVVLHSVFYQRRYFYDHHLKEVARVLTDADGEYRIDRLNIEPVHFGDGGMVYVTAGSPDHATRLASPLAGVTPGYRNRLADIPLSRERHEVRGKVVDIWEGKPVAGARVVVTGLIQPINYPKDQREALFLLAPETVTDKEARFVLKDVGAGLQMFSIHGGNDCAGYKSVQIPAKRELVLTSRQIRGRIEGRVVDEQERPIPLVMVNGGENSTHTFADGTFVLENFRGDRIRIDFIHPEYVAQAVADVPDGEKALLVKLVAPRPVVRFSVRDQEKREPVVRITAEFSFESEPPPRNTSPHRLSGNGIHAIRLPEGAVGIKIEAPGLAPRSIELRGLRSGDLVDVLLSRE